MLGSQLSSDSRLAVNGVGTAARGSRDSSAGLVIGYGLVDQRGLILSPGRLKNSVHIVWTIFGTYLTASVV
jgi:hypothetical protein